MKFPVGTKFIERRKNYTREHTVFDYHVTKNLASEVVRERYIVTHELMGQPITSDVCETTIAIALSKQ